jgi:hypothetical protein
MNSCFHEFDVEHAGVGEPTIFSSIATASAFPKAFQCCVGTDCMEFETNPKHKLSWILKFISEPLLDFKSYN